MDNDLRRRQYDMTGVQLKKRGEFFSFFVPGFQDITPPVLKGDSIDVFDPDEPAQDDTKRKLTFQATSYLAWLWLNVFHEDFVSMIDRHEVPRVYKGLQNVERRPY